MICIFIVFLVSALFTSNAYGKEVPYTLEDRDRLIRVETKIEQLEKRFSERFNDINNRFEEINRRFEDINRRFEDINRRFEDINKRFEDINRRFEDINRRLDQFMTFLIILAGIFTTLTLGVIGFALWDRRTIIRRAKEETLEEIEKRGNLKKLVDALTEVLIELSKIDPRIEAILKKFGIL